ncbi:MAG: Na/Pi symporter [Rhodothermia bacterium]|nr:Na/Pi symporter [Rhodothermia bacterium]
MRSLRGALPYLALTAALFVFFVGLELLGSSLKLMGRDVAATLIETTSNPFVALFIGILATSLVQSSSTVTSLTVSLVAGGGLTVAGAIPIVMGANVGTSITNTFVSLGHVTRKDEFRRAFAGATVHDIFNLLTLLLIFPLELGFGLLSKPARWMASGISDIGGADLLSPVKLLTRPITEWIIELANSNGFVVMIVGAACLFGSLRYLVTILRLISSDRSEALIHKYLFGTAPKALMVGAIVTVMVQSSSITTSVIVPLVGAGLVSVTQVYPFILGANLGTTITALMAALVLAGGGEMAGAAALQVAIAHLLFNSLGTSLFLPIPGVRDVPVRLAEALGKAAANNRLYALAYIVTVFFVIPLLVILITRGLGA